MPKLLDIVKESGLSHEEVVDLIKNRDVKPNGEEEGEDEPDVKEGENDKPDSKGEDEKEEEEEEETEGDDEEPEELSDEEKEEIKKKTDAKITELVQDEVIKQLKIKRKTPSKGKLKKKPTIEYGISNRGYEELV